MTQRLHCVSEGPWYKRLRMFLFGLTAKEQAENFDIFAAMQREVREEMAREAEEDERWLKEWRKERK